MIARCKCTVISILKGRVHQAYIYDPYAHHGMGIHILLCFQVGQFTKPPAATEAVADGDGGVDADELAQKMSMLNGSVSASLYR